MNNTEIASQLDKAAKESVAITQFGKNIADLAAAYDIQKLVVEQRYARGERFVGLKLGFTSKAKMVQMGVQDLIWGRLTDKMHYENEGVLHISNFIHPRAEPEIAFLIKETIEEVVTLDNALQYIDSVAVALEIIDSRYQNFKFSLEDVIADNCSSAGFAVGEWQPATINVRDILVQLIINGEVVEQDSSNAILGNPLEAFVAAARLARANGETLQKGAIILAGAATPAVFLKENDKVTATAEGLGSVTLYVSQ